jgi:hypothetical protein
MIALEMIENNLLAQGGKHSIIVDTSILIIKLSHLLSTTNNLI